MKMFPEPEPVNVRIIHRTPPEIMIDGTLIEDIVHDSEIQIILCALDAACVDYEVEEFKIVGSDDVVPIEECSG